MQSRTKRAASTRVDTGQRTRTPAPVGAGNTITAELYEAARDAYVGHGTLSAVREATGLGQGAAQRLLDSGIPQLGLPSLRDAARAEASKVEARLRKREDAAATLEAKELAKVMEARAQAQKRAREHETKVLGDAERSRAEEVQLVRLNRISATVLAQVNADLLRVSSSLAKSLLEDQAALRKLTPKERLGILRTVAGVVHRTAQASAASVNMERLLMGQPTAILGRADGPSTQHMTPEEAEQWLALANRAFARRAARRTVVDAEVVREEDGAEEAEDEAVAELVEDLA